MQHTNTLAIFAADHRGSFERFFAGVSASTLRDYKKMLAEAFLQANVSDAQPVFLSDLQYGESALMMAQMQGKGVAVPLEKSGGKVFELEKGQYLEKAAGLQPNFAKCLVKVSVAFAQEELAGVVSDLKKASAWADAHSARLIIEIVPKISVDAITHGETSAHDLTFVMDYLWRTGIRPTYWKVPGSQQKKYYDTLERYFDQGHDIARLLVLGADAPIETVKQWLRVAVESRHVAGFAVGRSLWRESLLAYHQGRLAREEAIFDIARRYEACCEAMSRTIMRV